MSLVVWQVENKSKSLIKQYWRKIIIKPKQIQVIFSHSLNIYFMVINSQKKWNKATKIKTKIKRGRVHDLIIYFCYLISTRRSNLTTDHCLVLDHKFFFGILLKLFINVNVIVILMILLLFLLFICTFSPLKRKTLVKC